MVGKNTRHVACVHRDCPAFDQTSNLAFVVSHDDRAVALHDGERVADSSKRIPLKQYATAGFSAGPNG
jgi:hypothetical protein